VKRVRWNVAGQSGCLIKEHMTTETKTAWDKWWTLLMVVAFAGSAWFMAAMQWVYPPIPMFIAAVMGGWLFRGRPQSAARASYGLAFYGVGLPNGPIFPCV